MSWNVLSKADLIFPSLASQEYRAAACKAESSSARVQRKGTETGKHFEASQFAERKVRNERVEPLMNKKES
jgi:hypothetical protein